MPLRVLVSEGSSTSGREAITVLGLSGRWRSEGLGSVRAHVLEQGAGPVMLARRGLGPSALAPPAALTRFTWSLDGA